MSFDDGTIKGLNSELQTKCIYFGLTFDRNFPERTSLSFYNKMQHGF